MAKKPKIEWPDPIEDAPLFRDRETRLPTMLYPFQIMRERDTGLWMLQHRVEDQVLAHGLADAFTAFRLMLDHYERWYPTRPRQHIYFIGSELKAGHRVKVGVSYDPEARLRQLQTASPMRLQIFATTPGTEADERYYHQRWSARRSSGEWFIIGDPILKEIERIRSMA